MALVKLLYQAVREDEGLEQHASLYAVQPGNFFGHDAFLPQSEGERPQQGKISFRAVTDCSMQTLFESDILQLVRGQTVAPPRYPACTVL